MSGFNPTLDPKPVQVRRLEVLTGVGGRRRWSSDDKARIVEETLTPGATVSDVARRHDIRPQQLFGWRRGMRISEPEPRMTFGPALVEAPEKPGRPRRHRAGDRRGGGLRAPRRGGQDRGGGDQGAEGRAVIPVFAGTPSSVRVLVGWHGPVALGQDAGARRLRLAQTAGWGNAADACAARGPAGRAGLAARAADSPDPGAGGDGVRLRRSESACTRGRHKAARICSDRAWPRRFPAMWRCCKPCS